MSEDKNVGDGIIAFRSVLEMTREVFGEERMTEPIICKALEVAGRAMNAAMWKGDGDA